MRHRLSGSPIEVLSTCLLLLAGLVCPLWSAQPYQPVLSDPILEPWRMQYFKQLSNRGLRCLAETPDGVMWFGVNEGVVRYDGLEWHTFTSEDGLVGASINVLAAGEDGSLYAGSEWGISRYRAGKWERIFPKDEALPWPVNDLEMTSDGSMWAGTGWGALRLTGQEMVLYTSASVAVAAQQVVPYLSFVVVPDEACRLDVWQDGLGVKTAQGGFIGVDRGDAPQVIWAVAPNSPGEAAGLQVGDCIVALKDYPRFPLSVLDRPKGTTLTLEIRHHGETDVKLLEITTDRVEGGVRHFPVHDVFEDRDGNMWFGKAI